jgi:hypothetical protein
MIQAPISELMATITGLLGGGMTTAMENLTKLVAPVVGVGFCLYLTTVCLQHMLGNSDELIPDLSLSA